MNELYYTIKANGSIIAQYIRAKYVPMMVKGMLAEWFADDSLKITIEAQEPNLVAAKKG